ncbi:MAG TPA: hypothetical protein VGA56_12065 [Opitutaceae bacterium]
MRQQRDQALGGGVLETHGAADHRRGRTVVAMAQNFVALAHEFARQVEQLCGPHAAFARENVAFAVRHKHEITALQPVTLATDFQRAATLRHEVKHQAAPHRRQHQSPRCRKLRATVERAGHAQEVQRFTQRIDRRPHLVVVHAVEQWR